MGLLDALVRTAPEQGESRFGFQDYVNTFSYNGHTYNIDGTMPGSKPRESDGSFLGMVRDVHDRSGPVSSAVFARQLIMSQVRFRWGDDDGELHNTPDLRVLHRPRSGWTRPEMLMALEADGSYAGNGYIHSTGRKLYRLAPERMSFMLGSDSDPTWDDRGQVTLPYDWEVVNLVYNSGDLARPVDERRLKVFNPSEIVHWKPEPDPDAPWRGQSWVTAVAKEVALDLQIGDHMSKFFEHAATPNLVFMMDPSKSPDDVKAYARAVNAKHGGSRNAYRNMFLGGGTDVKVVGSSFADLAFKDLQGGLETRVSVRSRVPAVILGIREGLSGSSLNTGNYSAARRLFADGWFSPTVEALCEAFEAILTPTSGRWLTHDPARILFLQEDQKDAAEIMNTLMTAARDGADGGYDPASVVAALKTNQIGKLVHTGKTSVQLHDPNEPMPAKVP